MVWEREHGPIPDGMVVCHRCDVKVCCNLAHLFIGTNADNQRDKREKGRARWRMSATNRIKRYILAPADVVSIRQRHAAGCVSVVALAAEYSVAVVTIRAILKGRLWPKVAAA